MGHALHRIGCLWILCVHLVVISQGHAISSGSEESDSEENYVVDGYVKIEDPVRLEEIQETFAREYLRHQNQANLDDTELDLDSSDNDSSVFVTQNHRSKRSASSRSLFCSLPSPQPIRDIFPEIIIFRRGHNSQTIQTYTPESRVLDMFGPWIRHVSRVVYVTHGFTASIQSEWLHQIKDNIMRHVREDVAVILIGWAVGAAPGWNPTGVYRQAAANTETIGRYIGGLNVLIKNRYSIPSYGIGHSLGAHVMGWVGKTSHMNRITGLDPAGPCFETDNVDKRLRHSDADLVDVIHTDGYQRFFPPQIHFGTLIHLGDLDFYPNWGRRMQPGCGRLSVACSHSRAIDLFTWSIAHPGRFTSKSMVQGRITWDRIDTSGTVTAVQSASMGYYADQRDFTKSGNFYQPTNQQAPWSTLEKRYFNLMHAQSGMVLDACTDKCAPGTVYLYHYHGQTNQQWFMDGELIRSRRFPDKVLDFNIRDHQTKGYGRIYLNPNVHAQDNQRFVYDKNGHFDVIYHRLLLDLKDNIQRNKAAVGCRYPHYREKSQEWYPTLGPAYFYIKHVPSGMVLDAHSRNGRDVTLMDKHDGHNQQWYTESGMLRNRMFPDKVLDFHERQFRESSDGWGKVYLTSVAHGGSNQKWNFVGGNAIESRWEDRGLRLDVSGGRFENGRPVGCCRRNGTPAQHWRRRHHIFEHCSHSIYECKLTLNK